MRASVLADLILLVHFAFVLFVVGGLALIVIGGVRGWPWIRGRGFRLAHLAAISFVALESVIGVACPLTVWEDALRAGPEGRSFIGRWVGRLLYYDFPEWVFTTVYIAFAFAVAAAWRFVPPHRKGRPPPVLGQP